LGFGLVYHVLGLGLGFEGQVFGIDIGLEGRVLGLGLSLEELCVLDSNTGQTNRMYGVLRILTLLSDCF